MRKGYIYRFLDKNGEVIYVGQTKNIRARMSVYLNYTTHGKIKLDDIYRIEYFECNNIATMNFFEIYFVNEFKPRFNGSLILEGKPTCVAFKKRKWITYAERRFGYNGEILKPIE